MGFNMNEFWDKTPYSNSDYYKRIPLTQRAILKAERQLGQKLPTELLELLRIRNGGYTQEFAYPMTERTSWSENHVPFSELMGIVFDKSKTQEASLLDSSHAEEWGLPKKQVPLCGDGHWFITLDYRTSEVPKVMWIDTECEEEVFIADSFKDFLNGLIPAELFE